MRFVERDKLGFRLKAIKKGLEGNRNKLESKTNWLVRSKNPRRKLF